MKKFKVLLMAVCNDRVNDVWEEIGICYIASYLRQHGYEVMLLQKKEKDIDYKSILDFKPDIVGFDIYDVSKESTFNVAKKIKDKLPDILICGGGPYPTYCHEEILQEAPFFNFSIRGEGEETFLELVQRLESNEDLRGIAGLTYIKDEEIIVNGDRELIEDLNSLPMPARDILVENKLKAAMISTSRGCLGNCSFCSNQLFWKKWRGRNSVNIVDEIEHIATNYDISLFNFTDASFEDPDKECKRLRSIASELVSRDLKIAYLADFRAEFHRKADDDLIKLLIDSGLCGACIGIETFNEFDIKLYRKIATIDDNCKIIEMFHKHNIITLCGIINFNPYSTFDGLYKNSVYMEKYKIAVNMEKLANRYRMYKKAALYTRIKEDGLLKDTPEFDEIGYRFLDQRIEKLANYISDYTAEINRKVPAAFYIITNYLENYYSFVFHLKNKAKALGNDSIDAIFENYMMESDSLRNQINISNSKWFKSLLELAEKGWNDELADKISEEYLSEQAVSNLVKRFNSLSGSLYIQLIRKDKSYANAFGKF